MTHKAADTLLPLLIEPQQLKPLLGRSELLILDLCRPENYAAGHLPGAIHVHPAETQLGVPPTPGLLPDAQQLQSLINKTGLNSDSHVVVYDDEGGGWAGRMIWILDSIGITRYSYLNGGLIAWQSEGHPLTQEVPQPKPTDFSTEIDKKPTVTADDIMASLSDEDFAVWDARTPEEFAGAKITAARNGHIPGAVNYEWTRAMDPQNYLRMRPLDKIKEELNHLGLDAGKTIVTHCQTHHRSGFTYLLGKILGWKMQGYAGSWSDWGNRTDTPIEN